MLEMIAIMISISTAACLAIVGTAELRARWADGKDQSDKDPEHYKLLSDPLAALRD